MCITQSRHLDGERREGCAVPVGSALKQHLSTATGASIPNTGLTGLKTERFTALFPETLRLVLLQISLFITRTILTEETLGDTDSAKKKLNTTW